MKTLLAYEETGRKMHLYRIEKIEYLAVYVSPAQGDTEYSRIMSEKEARAHYDELPIKVSAFIERKEKEGKREDENLE